MSTIRFPRPTGTSTYRSDSASPPPARALRLGFMLPKPTNNCCCLLMNSCMHDAIASLPCICQSHEPWMCHLSLRPQAHQMRWYCTTSSLSPMGAQQRRLCGPSLRSPAPCLGTPFPQARTLQTTRTTSTYAYNVMLPGRRKQTLHSRTWDY